MKARFYKIFEKRITIRNYALATNDNKISNNKKKKQFNFKREIHTLITINQTIINTKYNLQNQKQYQTKTKLMKLSSITQNKVI